MALDVLHQMLIYAEALLIVKHSVGLKSYFEGCVRISWRHHPFLKRHIHFELTPGMTQITLPNNKCLQSTLESKHTIKIKRFTVPPKGYCLPPYSDFKKTSLIWTSLPRVRNKNRKGLLSQQAAGKHKLINEKLAWNEKHYFARQHTVLNKL